MPVFDQRAVYHPTPTQLREIELDRDLHVKRQLDGACAEGSSTIFSFYHLLISSSVHQKCDLAQIAYPAWPSFVTWKPLCRQTD